MRTPVVKSQTPPLSGFWLFFRFPGAWRDPPPVAWAALRAVHGRPRRVAAPHTSGGALVPCVTRAAPPGGAPLRPRHEVSPPPVLRTSRAASRQCAPVRRGGGAGHVPLRRSTAAARRAPRRPRPSRHERAPPPGATVPARLAGGGGAAWRRRDARGRRPSARQARRDRSPRG